MNLEYTMLVNRGNSNIKFGDADLYKLSKKEVENRIREIKLKFIKAVEDKHHS